MKNKGSIVVLLLPFMLMLWAGCILFLRWSDGLRGSEKARITAESALRAMLSLKKDALEAMALREQDLQWFVGSANEEGLTLNPGSLADFRKEVQSIKNALPGYKGRIRSCRTVIMECNEAVPLSLTLADHDPADLEITSQGTWVKEKESRQWLENVWLRRSWGSGLDPLESASVSRAVVSYPTFFGTVSRSFSAGVRWDVSRDDVLIQQKGNGGYPDRWKSVLDASQFNPHRWPVYRVDAIEDNGS